MGRLCRRRNLAGHHRDRLHTDDALGRDGYVRHELRADVPVLDVAADRALPDSEWRLTNSCCLLQYIVRALPLACLHGTRASDSFVRDKWHGSV